MKVHVIGNVRYWPVTDGQQLEIDTGLTLVPLVALGVLESEFRHAVGVAIERRGSITSASSGRQWA